MTIYDPVGPVAQSLDAREVAPIAATEDMFKGNASISQRGADIIPDRSIQLFPLLFN
jgi:gamma-glutamyltranspeptidase